MSRIWQWNCIAYARMLVKLGLTVAVGGAILSSWGCGNGLLPVLVGTGGFIAGINSQTDSQDGVAGLDGVNCWDLNGDRINDEEEDTNGDGEWTALDCQGEAGQSGAEGQQHEAGQQGPKGDQGDVGPRGIPGESGADGSDGFSEILECWVVCPASFREPCVIVCPE